MSEHRRSLDLVKARISLAHAEEIKYQINLMRMSGHATDLDYSNAVLRWVDAVGEVWKLEQEAPNE